MNRARSGAGSIPSARESAAVPPRIGASSDSVFARIPEQKSDSSDAHRNTLPGIRRRMGGHTEAFMEQTPTEPVEGVGDYMRNSDKRTRTRNGSYRAPIWRPFSASKVR